MECYMYLRKSFSRFFCYEILEKIVLFFIFWENKFCFLLDVIAAKLERFSILSICWKGNEYGHKLTYFNLRNIAKKY